MNDQREAGASQGGGLNERAVDPGADQTLAENAGSSSGTNSLAAGGDPAGADADSSLAASPAVRLAKDEDKEIVAEAAALGSGAAGSPAAVGRTLGDTPGTGAGRDAGSGTGSDTGDLGGGAPPDQGGDTGPAGAASPGGDHRG